jgi:hypothetical protein
METTLVARGPLKNGRPSHNGPKNGGRKGIRYPFLSILGHFRASTFVCVKKRFFKIDFFSGPLEVQLSCYLILLTDGKGSFLLGITKNDKIFTG